MSGGVPPATCVLNFWMSPSTTALRVSAGWVAMKSFMISAPWPLLMDRLSLGIHTSTVPGLEAGADDAALEVAGADEAALEAPVTVAVGTAVAVEVVAEAGAAVVVATLVWLAVAVA